MTDIEQKALGAQVDIDAAKAYLKGTGPWDLDEIGIDENDPLVQAFARHRIAALEARGLEIREKNDDER